MTDILDLARKAGVSVYYLTKYATDEQIQSFAALIRAQVIEECAKVCDDKEKYSLDLADRLRQQGRDNLLVEGADGQSATYCNAAAAIRALAGGK